MKIGTTFYSIYNALAELDKMDIKESCTIEFYINYWLANH